MIISRRCKFYRYSAAITVDMSFGYCDLDCDKTNCEGDIDSCEKPVALKIYLFEQIKRGGGLEWERKRDVLSSEDHKV